MIECLWCKVIVRHNPRQIEGCGCDPDSPTWVYVEPSGAVKWFSQAKWRNTDETQ